MKMVSSMPDYAAVLKLLPEEITKLVSSLSPEDLEILAYLIAFSSETRAIAEHSKRSNQRLLYSNRVASIQNPQDTPKLPETPSPPLLNDALQSRKPALFECSCFQCYTSYWSRWGASPNQWKIDEAISLYEDHIGTKMPQKKKKYEKGEKKNEGRAKGQRGQEKSKQKEVAAEKTETCVAITVKSLPGESATSVPQQQRKDASKVVKSSKGFLGGNNGTKRRSKQGKANSAKPSVATPVKKTEGKDLQSCSTKEQPPTKGAAMKSSRVAPFVGDGTMGNRNDCDDISCLENFSQETPSALHRGKKLFSLMANQLWGFFS